EASKVVDVQNRRDAAAVAVGPAPHADADDGAAGGGLAAGSAAVNVIDQERRGRDGNRGVGIDAEERVGAVGDAVAAGGERLGHGGRKRSALAAPPDGD